MLTLSSLLGSCSDDVDYLDVANMTDGMVGTELANIVEVAAINMLRDGRTEVVTAPADIVTFWLIILYFYISSIL